MPHTSEKSSEEWRTIAGYETYEVSNLGRVRNWRSRNGRGLASRPTLVRTLPFHDKPYLRVTLYRNGVPKLRRVHQLVLEAFVGLRAAGMDACHNDGDATNNHLSNLRWGTRQENADDRTRHGTQVRGESVSLAVLTEEQAREIKDHLRSGHWSRGDGRLFARKFGVGDSAISSVKNNLTWNHV